jgi:hypothetical protein
MQSRFDSGAAFLFFWFEYGKFICSMSKSFIKNMQINMQVSLQILKKIT